MAVKQRPKKEGDHSETWKKSLSRDERSCFKTVGGNVFGIQKEVHSLLSKSSLKTEALSLSREN